ncbi:MAG: PilC/PilY family type IV pilus protein [Pseudomonadota bacterium]|nr:PilC/PilY family type IV pilus protein [Pseudomonadota bacterium]
MKIKLRHAALALSAGALTTSLVATAADPALTDSMVDLANKPITQLIDLNQAGPNVMLIMDDGRYMARDIMSADLLDYTTRWGMGNVFQGSTLPCGLYHGTNTLAYNPNYTYELPVKQVNEDGTLVRYDAARFDMALIDGYKAAHNTTDTRYWSDPAVTSGVNGRGYGWNDLNSYAVKLALGGESLGPSLWESTSDGAYYYKPAAGTTPPSDISTNGDYCMDRSKWEKVLVKNATAAQKQNYANWLTYYRTRMNTLKSASTLVFSKLDDTFSVGLMTATQTRLRNQNSQTDFINVAKMNVAQKNKLLAAIQAAGFKGGGADAGLPWALSTTGRYFAGKLKDQTWAVSGSPVYDSGTIVNDPMKFSCQKSYSIIASAGYYQRAATTAGMGCLVSRNALGSGACDLDGVEIPDADKDAPWPFKDYDTARNPNDARSYNVSGLLSDVAYYYANTDLRTGSKEKLESTMGTFVINLGEPGYLKWRENYEQCTTAECDYAYLKDTTTPDAQRTKWWFKLKYDSDKVPGQSRTGTISNAQTNTIGGSSSVSRRLQIDDHWHAAVNGGGTYFNASAVDSLVHGLKKALAEIAARSGAGTGASTTAMTFSSGTGSFVSSYRTVAWTGDLQRRSIDADTGAVGSTNVWTDGTAAQQLDQRVRGAGTPTNPRTIYTNWAGALVDFSSSNDTLVTNLVSAKYFEAGTTNPDASTGQTALSQHGGYTSAAQTATTGTDGAKNMIDFLRGSRAKEMGFGNAADNRLYRNRNSALGDMVNSPIVHVGNKVVMDFTDEGYDAFKTTVESRAPTVYVGANDGMLHAFDAASGAERWAFIPAAVLPNLYKLADAGYGDARGNNHRYFVDGHISVQDVYFDDKWHTVLIGGLGKGGRAFYALDITDGTPKLLWEFTHQDMGYSYGNVLITKISGEADRNKQWVAVFGSGYNNNAVTGATAGNGRTNLFVLKLKTGELLKQFTATNGSDQPVSSGLAWINGWTGQGMQDSTVRHVYGGDLGGNVWRFDLTKATNTAPDLLAVLKDAQGNTQPVTSRPELGDILNTAGGTSTQRAIYIATGRYLGDMRVYDPNNKTVAGDASDRSVQTVYAIRDDSAGLKQYANSFRSVSGVVQFSTEGDGAERKIQYAQVTARAPGWYMDLPAGERVTVMPMLFMGDQTTLVVASNLPDATFTEACNAGGKGYVYAMQTQPTSSMKSAEGTVFAFGAQIVGMSGGVLSTGQGVGLVGFDSGKVENVRVDIKTGAGATVRRTSWRELVN